MSTRSTSPHTNREKIARTVDKMLLKLAIISPLALLAFLASSQVRSNGEVLIVLALIIALGWAITDVHRGNY